MKKNLNSWSAATACLFIAASIAFGQDVSAPAATPPPTSIQLPSDSHDAGAPADAAVSPKRTSLPQLPRLPKRPQPQQQPKRK